MTNVARCAIARVPDAVLLEKVVYTNMNVTATVTANRQLKGLIYHPEFIQTIVRRTQQVMRAIPDSHPNYLNMVLSVLPKRPQLFNYVTLRYKRHPRVAEALFNAKATYDDIYKHMAMQYTLTPNNAKSFAKHNGLLYLELPIEKRQDQYWPTMPMFKTILSCLTFLKMCVTYLMLRGLFMPRSHVQSGDGTTSLGTKGKCCFSTD